MSRRLLYVFVFAIAGFITALVWGGIARAQDSYLLDAKVSKAISMVVDPDGVEVHIYCDRYVDPWATPGDWRGRNTWVSPVRCAQAVALAEGLRPTSKAKREFGEALLYLLRGANIAVGLYLDIAECKAIQQVEFLAEELGVKGRKYAGELADFAWKRAYRVPACRPGGPLDFHLGRWPAAAYLPPAKGGTG